MTALRWYDQEQRPVNPIMTTDGERMSNSTELVQVTGEIVHRPTTFALTPTQANAWADQVRDMRRSVLHEGSDFMVIPGTRQPSLLKPGAEMLLLAAGLGFTINQVDNTVTRQEGGRTDGGVTYRCTIHRETKANVVAECDGYAGYDEDRFQKGRFVAPLNSVIKMAQKRALVGATLNATASSGLFTQDLEDDTTKVPAWDPAGVVTPWIEKLDDGQTARLVAWIKGEGLPHRARLTQDQAAAVLVEIGAILAGYPTAAPTQEPPVEPDHAPTTVDPETGEVHEPASPRTYGPPSKLHMTANDMGISAEDFDAICLHVTGGRTSSAKDLTPSEDGKVREEMRAVTVNPSRMVSIRNKVAEHAGQQTIGGVT